MNTDQAKQKVAQPAEESLKKHGDQLEQQVREAAGEQLQHEDNEKGREAPPNRSRQ